MALGASKRIVDNETDLDAENINSLEIGLNVFLSPTGGLNWRVSAGTYWLVTDRGTVATAFAATGDAAVSASVTTFVYLDIDGALQTSEVSFPSAPHYPMAEIASGGSAITTITDRRPKVVHFSRAPTSVRTGFRAGIYYGQIQARPQGSELMEADTLIAVPWLVGETMVIDRIAIEVTTSQPGAVVRLGLYAEHATNRMEPGALLEDLGTISAASTGVKELSLSGARTLLTGWVLPVAISSDAAVGFRAYVSQHTGSGPLGLNPATFNEAYTHWHGPAGSHAAASALPDPFPASPVVQTDDQPCIAFRKEP